MLKALELCGFKSFADKTRFEFPAGITVVVGPNGSGKSNIVDAIKWVLGEQSAKSLRGKEMADVIFKGAGGPNGRKPANSATATIVIDNTDRRFPYDADEITIGRRVYRSGEAEYLINGETCRLKDIKNLFRGTGVGTDAYSLIEQGKVDRLLQASAKDRRAIFEEAAGISRFKAKKIEAQRRLERVEANLVRLADIVDEVASRYRSVKAQASKAARFKEYSDRLKELRTYVGIKDWRAFSERLAQLESERDEAQAKIASATTAMQDLAKQQADVEHDLEEHSNSYRAFSEQVTQVREQYAQLESQLELNRGRLADVVARREELTKQLELAQARHRTLEERIVSDRESRESSEREFDTANQQLKELDDQITSLDRQIEELQATAINQRDESSSISAAVAELLTSVASAESERTRWSSDQQRLTQAITELQSEADGLSRQLELKQAKIQELERQAAARDSELAAARTELASTRENREKLESLIASLNSKHAGVSQRIQVLEELEQKLEGVNSGARELLQKAKASPTPPYSDILGVVADLIQVNVQHAGIVDVALGDVAQYLVVDGHRLIDDLAAERLTVRGRVGIVRLSQPPTLGTDFEVNMNGLRGIIGRADRLVQVDPRYAPFVRQVLGGTWLVESLAAALELRRQKPARIRLVTLDGEIVEPDGTVVVGPKSAATGLVSRRSELRSLHRDLADLQTRLSQATGRLAELKQVEAKADERVQTLLGENSRHSSQLSELAAVSRQIEEQLATIRGRLEEHESELDSVAEALLQWGGRLASAQAELQARQERLSELKVSLQQAQEREQSLRSERQVLDQQRTQQKVALAKFEQRLNDIRARQESSQQEFESAESELRRLERQMDADRRTEESATVEIEDLTRRLSELQEARARAEEELEQVNAKKTELEKRRRETAQALNSARDQLRTAEDQLHQVELKAEHLKSERQRLAERLLEDYEIDIATLEITDETPEQQAEREAIDQEISELRRKIGAIGSVNLDALAELEELEARYLAMDEQYQDLVNAKESLERIIARINNDSRRLFVETLEAIRTNFQKLFRQTFGGGHADIILEEGVDPLEAGVEIVATPPGKPQFSNSLLSGGEKALTAVSLLMAIFQFRPSPFCVLDEVDAPFDEANIGRFIDVLKSFLDWTKFVIVTHSKKTMTAATTLYGVTMQESGVSKRVSVRFEDVNEDGHISEDALRRQAEEEAA